MGNTERQQILTEAAYLAAERDSDVRHEYVEGVPFAMTGASRTHNLLSTNLVAALHARLKGGPCRVAASDMKVRLAEGSRYYYPDVVVSCNDTHDEPDDYVESSPVLVVEILSDSTEAIDRREKRLAYQALPSLQDYVLVSQHTRQVERYTRDPDGWTCTRAGTGDMLELVSIGGSLMVDEIYADTALDA